MTDEELVKAIRRLSPAQRASLGLGGGGGASQGTPKFSPAIDAIPADEVDSALHACSLVTSAADKTEESKAIAACREQFPELVDAATANSHYRQKTIGHSFNVAALRLLARKAKGN